MSQIKKPARYKQGLILTKDNKLIRIHGNMTPMSYKLINYFLWRAVNEGRLDNLQAGAMEVSRIFNIRDNKRGSAFKAECKKAMETLVEIQEKDDTEKWTFIPLISMMSYDHGILTADVNVKITPYLKDLKGNFTPVEIKHLGIMGSYGSMRLYEVCLSWKRAGQVTYSVDEWRGLLGATKKTYDAFPQFRRRIWEPSVDNVNRLTDIRLNPSYVKQGRKVTHITVRISQVQTLEVDPMPEDPQSLLLSHENPIQKTLDEAPIDELQSLYEATGATPSAVRKWRKKYPEDALRWLLGKIKQAKPKDVGAWLGAACRDGGWLMNAYQIEMQEKRERAEKARNTAHFVIPEIPADAVPIPFDVSDALEKALVAVIKQHLQNGDLNVTSKRALVEHRMQPAEFAERYL